MEAWRRRQTTRRRDIDAMEEYGRCLEWDVICPDTLAASYLDKAIT